MDFFFQHLLNSYCNDYSGSCVFPKFNGVLFLEKGDCASPAWANVAVTQTDRLGMAHLTIYVFFGPATITVWPTSHYINRQQYAASRLNYGVGTPTEIEPMHMEMKVLDCVCIQSDLLHHISPWTCSNNTLHECAYAKWTWTSRWTGGSHDPLIHRFVMKKDAGQIDQQKHMETFLTYKNSAMLSFSNQSKAIRISVLDHDFIDVAENIEKGSLKYTVGGQDGQDFVEDFKHLFPREVTEFFANRTIAPAPAHPPAAVLAPAPAPDPALASDPATVLASAPLNISAANQAHPPASEQHNSNDETPAKK